MHPRDDAALADHTPTVDGTHVNTTDPHVSDPELETPEDLAPSTLREAIGHAVENNRAHHSAYPPPKSRIHEHTPDVTSGERVPPTTPVGLYVPRSKEPFPPATTMPAVPAVPAGVPRVAARTPPGPDRSVDAATPPAARLCGADTMHKTGGPKPSPGPARAD